MIETKIQIGSMEVSNRIVMPPIATYQATDAGHVTEKMLSYYGARAAGGSIGLIITEHSYISLEGKAKAKQLSISDDSDIRGLRKLTDVITNGWGLPIHCCYLVLDRGVEHGGVGPETLTERRFQPRRARV